MVPSQERGKGKGKKKGGFGKGRMEDPDNWTLKKGRKKTAVSYQEARQGKASLWCYYAGEKEEKTEEITTLPGRGKFIAMSDGHSGKKEEGGRRSSS